MKKPKLVRVFGNGATACFDDQGQQIGELQEGLIVLWAEHATRLGWDVDGLIVDGHFGKCRIFKTEIGWNWESA